ncbi:hypothetical protein CSUI_004472 [Cystoisospora suis]|uniref:Uncharacterized protein n=1 Tax=Cystoisospora suis TaxID=483139 RepID=A0A2C6L0T7_9APIC|nr:hypothetical protein CSUI_004472 [Cystoisospora suis]
MLHILVLVLNIISSGTFVHTFVRVCVQGCLFYITLLCGSTTRVGRVPAAPTHPVMTSLFSGEGNVVSLSSEDDADDQILETRDDIDQLRTLCVVLLVATMLLFPTADYCDFFVVLEKLGGCF